MNRPHLLIRAASRDRGSTRLSTTLLLALALVAGCAGAATPRPSPTVQAGFAVLDRITKPSVEAGQVDFGALVDGAGIAPGSIAQNLREDASWSDSGWSGLCRLDAQAGPGKTARPYSSGGICLGGTPTERRDFCAAAYDPPAAKALDSAHPDAIQPALDRSDFATTGQFKGWLSWQVESRPDCDSHLSAMFRPLDAAAGDNSRDIEFGPWTDGGPDADKPGVSRLLDVHLTGSDQVESPPFDMPDDGALVLRIEAAGVPSCDVGAAFYRWNEIRPTSIPAQYRATVTSEQPVVEVPVSDGISGSHTGYLTGCAGVTVELLRRGPPY